MRAVLHHDAGSAVLALLERHRTDWLDLGWTPVRDRRHLGAALADADVLLHVLDPVDDAMLARAPRLRLVQKVGVGVNTIDLDAARARGIAVANMPGVNTVAAAEHALALLLAVLRRLPAYHAATRAGDGWAVDPSLDNVVLTPHVAWLTVETLARGLVVAVENCRRLHAGEDLVHRIV